MSIAQLIFVLLPIIPLTLCVPESPFYGKISSDPEVQWTVEFICDDCLLKHFEFDSQMNGHFEVPLELEPKILFDGQAGYRDIEQVYVKITSKSQLAAQIRSYEWNLIPVFGHLHHFKFGHFAPSPTKNKGLYLVAKFENPLPEPRTFGDALLEDYWVQICGEGIGIIEQREMLDPDEWRGQKEFQVDLGASKIVDYLRAKQDPNLDFYVIKMPKCQKCGRTKSEKDEEVLYKKKGENDEFTHLTCHERINERKEIAHKRRNCNCHNCWKQRYFEQGEVAELKQSQIFHANLKMPILQNGEEPFFVYEFDPTKSKENYNYVQLEYMPKN